MGCKHSSNMTLSVFSADKLGEKLRNSVLKTLIPSVKNIQGRYPNLKKHLYLLPFALADRIVKYQKEISVTESDRSSAVEAINIGNERIELWKQYGIIAK